MSSFDPEKSEYIDSLRLSQREQDELIAKLDHSSPTPGTDERRIDERVPYQRQAGLIVQMRHPGGSIANYLVRARNLSTSGIGFLHGSFVYPGTRCSLALITIDNRIVRVEGQVVRCRLVCRHIHEVGVHFDRSIRMRDFVARDLVVGTDVETSTELPRLSGQVLYVEDSISDQELLKFYLGKLGTKVTTVSNGLAALDLASDTKFDAVITGVWLPVMSGAEVAKSLRDMGYAGPIIGLSADERPETAADAVAHGCTCVLTKPYKFEQLIEVLVKHMAVRGSDGDEDEMLISELWADKAMRPLICTFLQRLEDQINEIKRLLQSGKNDMILRKLCLDLKGTAGGYGYPQISQAAQELLEAIAAGSPAEQLKELFGALAGLYQSACRAVAKEGAALMEALAHNNSHGAPKKGGSRVA